MTISKVINGFATLGMIATFAAGGLAIGGKAAQAETGGTVGQARCWPEPQTEITERPAVARAASLVFKDGQPAAVVIHLLATKCEPDAVIIQASLWGVVWKLGELVRDHLFMESMRTGSRRVLEGGQPKPHDSAIERDVCRVVKNPGLLEPKKAR